ncbi:MAG: hypothetical protein QHH13_10085 [Melioribacter sp.]|uniref:hypothetical protein n=1 Tax=Rosettibacter primus TaxID=3111523 RepID=UPI00247D3DFE|nr:hypothetical protein [Melioribacter sp.]
MKFVFNIFLFNPFGISTFAFAVENKLEVSQSEITNAFVMLLTAFPFNSIISFSLKIKVEFCAKKKLLNES